MDEENTPIQNIEEIKTNSWLDIVNTTNVYKSILWDNYTISWTWANLYISNTRANCRRIIDINPKAKWIYSINPQWEEKNVYCDYKYLDSNFYDYI